MDKYFPVRVGDQVKIDPKYWGNGSDFVEPYRSNGKDHIYTVTAILTDYDGHGCCEIEIDGMRSHWSNEFLYLLPVEPEEDLKALGDVSALFE